MRVLLPIVVVLLCGACNLFTQTADGALDTDGADTGVRDASGDLSIPDMRTVDEPDMRDTTGVPDASADVPADVANQPDLPIADLGTDSGTPDDMPMMVDMADADMAPDAGVTDPCTWPDTIFCSGFEDPTFGDWGGNQTEDGVLTHNTSTVHTGTGSLRTEVLAGSGKSLVHAILSSALDNDDEMWIRSFVYVPASTSLAYFEWVGIGNLFTGEGGNAAIGNDYIDGHLHLDSYDGYPSAPYAVPKDQWVCIEWRLEFSATAGRSFVAVDGVDIVNESGLPLSVQAPLNLFALGFVYTDPAQTGVVFFDDVFVGRSRPGCDP